MKRKSGTSFAQKTTLKNFAFVISCFILLKRDLFDKNRI
jgi:hypothetical protein